jgi:hypothetical protein
MAETTAFAYHEAGHAVAAHVLQHGPAPMYVTIVPDGVTRGHVRPRPVRPQGDPASTMEMSLMEMVVRFAGPIAQIRHDPSSWQPISGYSDWHVACRLAILISRGMRVLGSDMDPRRQARTLLVAAAVEEQPSPSCSRTRQASPATAATAVIGTTAGLSSRPTSSRLISRCRR